MELAANAERETALSAIAAHKLNELSNGTD